MKILKIVFGIIVVFFLTSCDYFAEDTTVIESKDNKYISYASDITYTYSTYDKQLYAKDKFFDVTFNNVVYEPVLGKVCFSYNINDEDYERATYFLVLQKDGSYLTESQMTFTLMSEVGENLRSCFEDLDPGTKYKILLGKVDRDDLNPSSVLQGSASFTIEDKSRLLRDSVRLVSFDEDSTPEEIDIGVEPFILIESGINDPNRIIDKYTIVLTEKYFNNVVYTKEFTVNETDYIVDTLVIDEKISDLAPGVEYEYSIYIDGSDGVDEFKFINLVSRDIYSTRYDDTGETSLHDLYAIIENVEFHINFVEVFYSISNSEQIHYEDTGETVFFELVLYSFFEKEVVKSYGIINESGVIKIKNEYMYRGISVRIVDDRGGNVFAEYSLNISGPEILKMEIKNDIFIYNVDYNSITNVDVEFYLDFFSDPFEVHKNIDYSYGENNIDILYDLSDRSKIYIKLIITYTAYGHEFIFDEQRMIYIN